MNKRERIASAFRAAKPFLSLKATTKGVPYICWALEDAKDANKISRYDEWAAKDVVMGRIHPYVTVDEWLTDELNVTPTDNQLQEYRHRWLDALIEEFSK